MVDLRTIFILLASSSLVWTHAIPLPHALTAQGPVQGFNPIEGVTAFLGIPYAEPPVKDLRFKAPVPLNDTKGHSGLRNATSFGPVCHQLHYISVLGAENLKETTPQDEDCLTLNVWRPTNMKKGDKLPVMIWLYGGAYNEGGGSVPIYNLQSFVKNNPSVVMVSLNYRLGIFGFPHSSAVSGNFGLMDQRMAIEWLKKNIGGFGGDPSKMILFGESAGAVSSSAYSFAYKEDPIVRGFILQSGVAPGIGDTDDTPWNLAASSVGCNNTDKQKEYSCMVSKPAAEIQRGISNMTVNPFGAPNGGSPFADNKTVFTADEYLKRAAAGDFAKLPVLLGSNNNEGDGAVNFSPKTGINHTLADIVTQAIFGCPIALVAGNIAKNNVPVWRYRYMPVFPSVTFYPFVKTFHISDVPIVLGTYTNLVPHKDPTSAEIQASLLMQKAWVAFAHDPTNGLSTTSGLRWPRYDPTRPTLIQLFNGNNASAVDFVDPNIYDAACATTPKIGWMEIAAPPPAA